MNKQPVPANQFWTLLRHVGTIVGAFIVYQVGTIPLLMPAILKTSSLVVTLVLGGIGVLLLALISWWLWSLYRRLPAIDTLLKRPQRPLMWAVLLIGLMFLMNALMAFLIPQNTPNQATIDMASKSSPWLLALMIVIFSPIIEEFIFRGLMYRLLFPRLQTWGRLVVSILITALVFALAHNPALNLSLVVYLPPAILLSTTYVLFNDIRYSLTLHIINNAVSMLPMLLILK